MSVKKIIYLTLAILGFVVPWYYNIQFFAHAGLLEFVNQSSANLAAKSIGFDLFIATVTGSAWMYVESKRVGIRFGWLYIVIGFLVAFALALPLFLFMREIELEKSREASH
jgi:apolipoprotein N-acyltransferase